MFFANLNISLDASPRNNIQLDLFRRFVDNENEDILYKMVTHTMYS